MDTDRIFAEALANEYAPKSTSKVVALKKLDRRAKAPANIFAYTFGVVMTLIFGTGMCLGMQVIGPATTGSFIIGIVVGLIGMVGVAINYPIYKRLLEKGKRKYAFEIMELAKDICKEDE